VKYSDKLNPVVLLGLELKKEKHQFDKSKPNDIDNYEFEKIGNIEIELFYNMAPKTVKKFLKMRSNDL